MKKVLFVVACALAVVGAGAQEKVAFNKMPKAVQEFVQKNFSNDKVQNVEKGHNADKTEKYTLFFTNGNMIAFDNQGNWTEIDMQTGAVPTSTVPANITSYVSKNYSGAKIMQIMKNQNGYMVKLSSGTSLNFDKDGKLLKKEKK